MCASVCVLVHKLHKAGGTELKSDQKPYSIFDITDNMEIRANMDIRAGIDIRLNMDIRLIWILGMVWISGIECILGWYG